MSQMEAGFVNNYVNSDAEQQLSALIKMRESPAVSLDRHILNLKK